MITRPFSIAAIALAAVLGLWRPAHAAEPGATVPVVGALRTVAGGPVADGQYIFLVALYPSADAKLPQWDETLTKVDVTGGGFAIVLGANPAKPIAASWLEDGLPLWLEIQVGNEPPLPRRQLGRVPAAWRANVAGRAEDVQCSGCVGTGDLAAGAVTGAQLAAGAVGADHVAFPYAGAQTKGGPADSALEAEHAKFADDAKVAGKATLADEANSAALASKLACTGCVGVEHLDAGAKAAFVAAQAGQVTGGLTVAGGLALGDSVIEGGRLAAVDVTKAACGAGDLGRVAIDGGNKRLYFCDGATWQRLTVCAEVCPPAGTVACGQPLTNACGDAGTCAGKGTACSGGKACVADKCAAPGDAEGAPAASCKAIKTTDTQATSGLYWLDPDGAGGGAAFRTWCDMTTDGGGWAVVWASVKGDAGSRPYETDTYGTDPNKGKFKLTLAQIQALPNSQHLLLRTGAQNQWLRMDAGFLTKSQWPGHGHHATSIQSASGQTANATLAYANVQNAGGGWYAVVNGTPDHHSSNYLDLNSSCANDYVYTYGGNFFAVQTALGSGWPGGGCASADADHLATWILVR